MDVRAAEEGDIEPITAVALATGQEEAGTDGYPVYLRYLMRHGRFLVASAGDEVTGFGGTLPIGTGPAAISMLTDLFVHPSAHGTGVGRAILTELWQDQPRRMTFSSLHANALPLYSAFGVDAWWPLLYFSGQVSSLTVPAGFAVELADPGEVAALEYRWTGQNRESEHRAWAARRGGFCLVVRHAGQPVGAGSGTRHGLSHFVAAKSAGEHAAEAVIAALASLQLPEGKAELCVPAPHPVTRALLAAGWRIGGFDLHMASEFGLIDARLTVPSPDLA
ncbi:MAG TPA: GNAT family N-acetyltransferase [Streptosporangiaceae bacterium]|nr:GNAT family N-acetyltransferase [Streptosporangiaceae bacterium]